MPRRRRKKRKSGRGARSEKYTEVNIVRRGKATGRVAKVTKVRRRNGDVTEETYEL